MSEEHNGEIIGDKTYQEKLVQALLQEHEYAEQINDVLNPDFFDQEYLKNIVQCLFAYKQKYNSFPSNEILYDILNKSGVNQLVRSQIVTFFENVKKTPLNGDMSYIRDTSIDFCKKQAIKEGILKALNSLEKSNYDGIYKIISDSVNKCSTKDFGHDYLTGFDYRSQKSTRDPIATPWPVLNKAFGGGWERQTLNTVIAPTGAGKTHFLCNVSAGGIECGYNVCYISLEIADYKIGLRHDAYFSGIPINDVPENMEKVREVISNMPNRGRLFVKEFHVKTATVQTIRSYLQKLKSAKDFVPDILVIDYASLLRPSVIYGERRQDLEGTYEELRGLAQEWNLVLVTADQTNRSGLDEEVVSISQIGESYAKATVCDVILTLSRTNADKLTNTGRIYLAKSRLGADGIVYPISFNSSTVKIRVLEQVQTVGEIEGAALNLNKQTMIDKAKEFMNNNKKK